MRSTMLCVDVRLLAGVTSLAMTAACLVGCGGMHGDGRDKAASASTPANPVGSTGSTTQAATGKTAPASQSSKLKSEPAPRLGPPGKPRNWAQVREQAAHRLVAANPNISYTGKVPDVLLAIPVFSIQLNGDGSIRYIDVMRYPHQARDTVEIAKAALHRAEPFGDVSHLPKPWRFTETFLFNDQRKFKPLTLDR